jgi:hypothetical protein
MALKFSSFNSKTITLSFLPAPILLNGNPQAKAFTPITVIDNIGTSPLPDTTNQRSISQTAWFANSCTAPAPGGPCFITGLRLALSSLDTTPAGIAHLLRIVFYGATNLSAPAVNISEENKPTETVLRTVDYGAS